MNGLAILCVVLYHSTGWGFTAMFWWSNRYRDVSVPDFSQMGSLSYFGLRALEQGVIFGIPAFIFVSGFFIAVATRREQKTIDWRIVLTRIKNLIIPFLIWSLLIAALRWLEGERFTFGEMVMTIITGRVEDTYYFVPLLVQLLIISPLLIPLARDHMRKLLVVTGLIQLCLLLVRYPQILQLNIPSLEPIGSLNRSGFFLTYLFWFCFGISAGFHLKSLKSILDRIKHLLPIAAVFFFILGMIEWEVILRLSGKEWIGPQETLIDQLYAAAFIFSFLVYDRINLPYTDQLSDLGPRSFGIYLVHAPVLEYSARAIYHMLPALLAFQFAFQPLLIVLGLAVPLVLMASVNRSPARIFYKSIFG
jgi:peptidoglycan/LPS O-acetylase OafA/YrhL